MPHPLIEKLDADLEYELPKLTSFDKASGSRFINEDRLKSYLHSRDSAIIEGIEEEARKLIREEVTGGFEGQNEMNIEIATYNESVRDFIQILNSFKPKR